MGEARKKKINFVHPKVAKPVTISGVLGDDAKYYQRRIMSKPLVRRQDPYVALTKEQFRARFFSRFYDPSFEEVAVELEKVFE